METIKEFVIDQALIIIPVLYIIGTIIKGTEKINDKYIDIDGEEYFLTGDTVLFNKDGNLRPKLEDKDNHSIDATRYALETDMKTHGRERTYNSR